MNALRLTALALLLFTVGAREQCVPGPFQYNEDQRVEAVDGPGSGDCFDPFSNCDFVCTNDFECQNFLGPDARCEADGRCLSRQRCPLGQIDDFCQSADESCAYDPTAQFPLNDGVCLPISASPLGLGDTCPADVTTENPCGSGAFCMPIDGTEGVCVVACGNNSTCGAGFNCASPLLFFGGPQLCMPQCNLDTPDCGNPRMVCVQGNGLSCTPDNGACVLAGCNDTGACEDICPNGSADCDPGTFCIETLIGNCRVDGPDQFVATCRPPAREGEPCVLTETGSCEDGLACQPNGGGSATCVQQSATPAPDGSVCDPNSFGVNRCEPGSYCARTDVGGVCQRFCDDDGDDDGDCDSGFSCERANLFFGGPDGETENIRVCAAPCSALRECPDGLSCDVDADLCTSTGYCLPRESQSFCDDDNDCSFQPGFVCSADSRCTLPEDACLPDSCDLLDTTTCPAGFACSPFGSNGPTCVRQQDVRSDGESCDTFDRSFTQCEAQSVCVGSCMRFCDGEEDCPADQDCVRGNIADTDPADPFRLYNLRVCAEPCAGGCAPALSCDVDGDVCSSGNSYCLPFESSPLGCSNDADCISLPGATCSTAQSACLPPEDHCTL